MEEERGEATPTPTRRSPSRRTQVRRLSTDANLQLETRARESLPQLRYVHKMPTTRRSDRLNPPPRVPSVQFGEYAARMKKREYARKRRAEHRAEFAARRPTIPTSAPGQRTLEATKAAAATTLPRAPKSKTAVQRAAPSPRAAPRAPLRSTLFTPQVSVAAALARCLSSLGCAGVKTEADLLVVQKREEAECIRELGMIDTAVALLDDADISRHADFNVQRADVSRAWQTRKLVFSIALRDLRKLQSATPATDDKSSCEPDESDWYSSDESCGESFSNNSIDDGCSADSRRRREGRSARASRPEPAIEADPRSLEQLQRDGDSGDRDALVHLATYYRQKLSPKLAMHYCDRAIEVDRARGRDSLDAKFLLAQILFVDMDNYLGARPLLEFCAERGHTDAQHDLDSFVELFYPAASMTQSSPIPAPVLS